MEKYKVEMEKKAEARKQGLTLEELEKKEREAQVLEIPMGGGIPKKKTTKGKTARANSKGRPDLKAKKAAIKLAAAPVEIFVKGPKDGTDVKDDTPDNEATAETQPEVVPTETKPSYQMEPIEAENTLEMLQNALGSKGDESQASGTKKVLAKKAVVKKKVVTKKGKEDATVDSMQKFFNNYGENPHLQKIEEGYLKYLKA